MQPSPKQAPLETPCSSCLQDDEHVQHTCAVCCTVLLSKQHLLYWFNQTHVPLFYSGAVWLHVRKQELGFGLSPSQPNTWSLAAILRGVGTMEAMCHGVGCSGAGQWLFIPSSSGTGTMMVPVQSSRAPVNACSFLCPAYSLCFRDYAIG